MFAIFYGYSLFNYFEVLAIEKGYKRKLPIWLLYMLFFLLAITGVLKGSILIIGAFFSFIPLIPILQLMNFYYLKEQEGYQLKRKLQKGEKQFLALIWGSLFLLCLLGASS